MLLRRFLRPTVMAAARLWSTLQAVEIDHTRTNPTTDEDRPPSREA